MPTPDDIEDLPPFPYEGPDELEMPIRGALAQVVDPELALSIVDIGLVYGVTVTAERVDVRMTMTSAACPVADMIVEEVEHGIDSVVWPQRPISVELVWEPPWTPELMSAAGRRFMNG